MSDPTEQTAAPDDATAELDRIAREAEAEGEWQPGTEPAEAPADDGPDPAAVEQLQALITVVYEVQAARKGEHWRLTAQESEAIAQPAAAVLEKYGGDVVFGPEVSLVLAAGMVTAPRLMQDREIAKARAAAERERKQRQGERPEAQPADGGDEAGAGDADQ